VAGDKACRGDVESQQKRVERRGAFPSGGRTDRYRADNRIQAAPALPASMGASPGWLKRRRSRHDQTSKSEEAMNYHSDEETSAGVPAPAHAAMTPCDGSSRDDGGRGGYVLVVDDDPAMQRMITSYFEQRNVPARAVSQRSELSRHFARTHPSVVILDLQLGEDDGLDLMREIRSYSDVPIVIITGHRRDPVDRIVGLELGADDYLTKPFSLRELHARVRAILRRQEIGRATRTRDPERGGYRFDGWQLERRARRLLDPEGNPVSLTKGEYALLLAFLEAPQRPLTREQLLQATRVHEDIFDRSIDVQVLRLRRKLEVDTSAPHVIQTERGIGYIFTAAVDPF
jgi:DNA-binding response OmpR family regulator